MLQVLRTLISPLKSHMSSLESKLDRILVQKSNPSMSISPPASVHGRHVTKIEDDDVQAVEDKLEGMFITHFVPRVYVGS